MSTRNPAHHHPTGEETNRMIFYVIAATAIIAAMYRTSYHQHYFHGTCMLRFFCPANCGNYHMA